jgi:alpha-glucosidase
MRKLFSFIFMAFAFTAYAQHYTVTSPDGHITLSVDNGSTLTYSVKLDGQQMLAASPMGFAMRGEDDMKGNFEVLGEAKVTKGVEQWSPVVRNKHKECRVDYNALELPLKEKSGKYRKMTVNFRVMNDGVAFRYTLYGIPTIGMRYVHDELTGYNVPEQSNLWIPNFKYSQNGKGYQSSQEGEFVETPVKEIGDSIHAGLPGLIKVDASHWMVITEAALDNWPGMYLGRKDAPKNGYQLLTTKLAPLWGNDEKGDKVRCANETSSSWRVIMVGHNPGKFIESEIIRSLNEDCKLEDTSWIKPGMSAWDHWWSGEVKMEQNVIKQYIDFAAKEKWPYMLIDWTWYGPYCKPEADITKPAKQLDMPAIMAYARQKGVDIWLWLRCEDVNNNDQYLKAFPLFRQWGVKGVKIDFMDRDDQDMVNWYHRIIKATADNHLMLDFHGAYKPDGLERTYPNLLTREGVMGSEYYKFSDRVTPEHNVTLAYTRLLAGPMDYTPGGFLNVTRKQFKQQSPTLVFNTRAAELAKFVVYDSPFMCFCDHPDNVYGKVGEDFVSAVPTTWDDIHFLGGDPDTYVALAKKSGDEWYIGVINNSRQRNITLDLSFLPEGKYKVTCWADSKKSNTVATACNKRTLKIDSRKPLKVMLAKGGGYVAKIMKL